MDNNVCNQNKNSITKGVIYEMIIKRLIAEVYTKVLAVRGVAIKCDLKYSLNVPLFAVHRPAG